MLSTGGRLWEIRCSSRRADQDGFRGELRGKKPGAARWCFYAKAQLGPEEGMNGLYLNKWIVIQGEQWLVDL